MKGGSASDVYSVDSAGDQVIEASGGGTDTVLTTLASYTLGGALERLTFTGTGDFMGTGNDLRNTITGGDGNDTIAGLGGVDKLIGGLGDDTLLGGDSLDLLTGGLGNDRLDGGAGADTASYAGATGGVTVDLRIAGEQDTVGAGRDTLIAIENVAGSGGIDAINGSDGGNVLDGGGNRDTLYGHGGADTLIGGASSDLVWGGTGADRFVFQALTEIASGDRIADFTRAQGDTIDLSMIDTDAVQAGVQSFAFIGTAAFTGAGGANAELRYAAAGTAGDLTVQGDLDHDGLTDFSFLVRAASLQASAFVLMPI